MSSKIKSYIIKGLLYLSALFTFGMLLYIIFHILSNGIGYLKPSLFEWEYNSENVSLVPAFLNTLIMTVVSLAITIPFGIGSAIYLVEYAKRGSKSVKLVRLTTETLSGIPSIVYGLFGMLFFVTFLGFKQSILAGACTLAIMNLPSIMRSTEEALKSVPDSYREASYGLGAGKVRTIFRVVLPAAVSGILSGIILAIGRIVGETAALIYTAGTMQDLVGSIFDSGRTLSLHMYLLSTEALHSGEAYATAVVLLILLIVINAVSSFIAGRIGKNNR